METRNPKLEIRNKFKIQMGNAQNTQDQRVLIIGLSNSRFIETLTTRLGFLAATQGKESRNPERTKLRKKSSRERCRFFAFSYFRSFVIT